ncbi:MAG: ABC transporter ATP-binding protein [Anaerolineae bacterium]
MAMLDIRLRKRLENFTLELELAAPPGITALFGHSGAGKSMTLACVAGLTRPDGGRITLNGSVLFDSEQSINLPPQRRAVGYVMQDYLIFPHLSVAQNIAFGLTGLSRPEKVRVVEEALQRVGLAGFEERRPNELSGGQQQRVALARALVTQPRVLLLDEPFSALDGPTRALLRRDLLRLRADLGIPALFVTHDLAEAYLLADRIAVIEAGRLLQLGPPETVVYHPASRTVAELTGGGNFFSGQVIAQNSAEAMIQVGPVRLTVPPTPVELGSQVELSIRAERIMLIRKDAPVGLRENQVEGCIINELTDGFNHTLFFRLDEGQRLRQGGYDLEIMLPTYVYERLGVAHDKRWSATIKREAIHIFQGGDFHHGTF